MTTKDIRPKQGDITLNGHLWWTVECNMTVLADVQEACGGDLTPALGTSLKTVLIWLAAMVNDCNERHGKEQRYTARELGRKLSWQDLRRAKDVVFDLVADALRDDETDDETDDEAGSTNEPEDAGKNPESPETVPGV